MKPNFYLELKVKNIDLNMPSTDGIPSSLILIVSRLISCFHSYKKTYDTDDENINIAVSFPEYSRKNYRKIGYTIRFFAEERDKFDNLIDYLEANTFISKHFDVRGVKKVKADNILSYSAFIAKKIPRKLNVKAEKYNGLKIENYIDRCEYLHSLPNLRVKSSSNKNSFTIFIDKVSSQSFIANNNDVNSYGFSTNKNLTYLPDF